MTRKEAIKIIKECKEKKFKHTLYTVDEYYMAMDMAIEALTREDTFLDKVLEIIDKTYDEYARHLPIEEFGRGSNLTGQIKDAVLTLKGECK